MVCPKAMGARHPASVQRIQVLPVYLEAILKILTCSAFYIFLQWNLFEFRNL